MKKLSSALTGVSVRSELSTLSSLAKRFPLFAVLVAFALVLLSASSSQVAFAAPGDALFSGAQVYTIEIDFPQTAWWDSLTTYYDDGLEQYMAATVTFDGTVFDSVGVRLKGNSSYTHPNDKKPFRIKLDEFIGGQEIDGVDGLHLNNCFEDPTFLREKLYLDYARDAGIPGPRANFAELYLNGELWGFYSLVEHVDKTLLTSRFGNNGGNLYKAVDGFFGGPISDFKWYGSDPAAYYARYELKTDDSLDPWTDLVAVIDSLNNSADVATALPPVVDMSSVYRVFASDIILSSLDSYVGSGRNFYVYFDEVTGKMEWILWDTGMSYGSYWGAAQNYETLNLTYVSSTSNRPLASKIFADPVLSDEYLHELCRLFTLHFSSDLLNPKIDTLADLVRPYVYADPRKMYTDQDFEDNLDFDLTLGGHRKPGLKSFIAAREADIESQLTTLGISCPVTIDPGAVVINEFAADNTEILDPAGEAEDWIELFNNTDEVTYLDGAYLTDDYLDPTKWQFPAGTTIDPHGYLIVWADDDAGQEGLHAAFKLGAGGEAIMFSDPQGAVVDSVTFGAQTTNLTMARIPNGTGPFVQGLPTFNAQNGVGTGDVVINEFAADNDQILDPAGEAEDWIEMYNNTGTDVDLSGMFLSDDPGDPMKWAFPDSTVIPALSYLIVWADDDVGQEGLHASFKLSAGGEDVVFSDTGGNVLDAVTFGEQTTNLTMARIPNGTGDFFQGRPTFASRNGNPLAVGEVVINEFMADNTMIFDPAGEADDWIELFNPTSESIALGGNYLSDDPLDPAKWEFPGDATIDAGGYLIIWADDDATQEGLHASFKLSAGGEDVVFSNPDFSVVDSTSFGAQTTDHSMARIPNGTGPFVDTAAPTPGAENSDASDVGDAPVVLRTSIGPITPNPFRSGTVIGFSLAQQTSVRLQVFDLQGRLLRTLLDEQMPGGVHHLEFVPDNLASGVYLCRLQAGNEVHTERLLTIR
ncbi:MAG: CotH kinase family protein [Candidatus Eisenbacteria bacterium]|nr:CotH kinase family protein [Candidatus Eisenbacteria bacterium]